MAEPKTIESRRLEILDEEIVKILRQKTPAQRVAMALDTEKTWRQMLEAYLRFRYPDWDDKQIAQEIARRRLLGTS
jgi:hypothetical protein